MQKIPDGKVGKVSVVARVASLVTMMHCAQLIHKMAAHSLGVVVLYIN